MLQRTKTSRSKEFKRTCVMESYDAGAPAVAKKYNIAPSLIYKWRKMFRRPKSDMTLTQAPIVDKKLTEEIEALRKKNNQLMTILFKLIEQ